MDLRIKRDITELRKRGLSYRKIALALGSKDIHMTVANVISYYISRVPINDIPNKQQLKIMYENADSIIVIIKKSESLKESYDELGNTEYGYDITYNNFIQWIQYMGGYRVIQLPAYKSQGIDKGLSMLSKYHVGILDVNKEIILNNLSKSCQYICDLLQESTGYIIDPKYISKWCNSNGIKKERAKKAKKNSRTLQQ